MAAEPVARREPGMVEVAGRVMGHAKALHHAYGADVGRHGERDDLIAAQTTEHVRQHGAGRLARVASAPERSRQPPSDLVLRHERRDGDPDETDAAGLTRDFDGEATIAVLAPVSLHAVDEAV